MTSAAECTPAAGSSPGARPPSASAAPANTHTHTRSTDGRAAALVSVNAFKLAAENLRGADLQQQQVIWDPLNWLKKQIMKGGSGFISHDVTLKVAANPDGRPKLENRADIDLMLTALLYLQEGSRGHRARGKHGDD